MAIRITSRLDGSGTAANETRKCALDALSAEALLEPARLNRAS